jgi:hypothetical protein
VEYRQREFIPFMDSLDEQIVKWNENLDREPLSPRMAEWKSQFDRLPEEIRLLAFKSVLCEPMVRPIIPIAHDECTYHANDALHFQWVKQDHNPLRKKGRGAALMVSEFLLPIGRLKLPPDKSSPEYLHQLRLIEPYATEILQCGGDRWFDMEYLVEQLLFKAIPIFEAAFPGHQALFIFDNATIHSAYSKRALRASKMNLGPAGKTPEMDPGWFVLDGVHYDQPMQFSNDPAVPAQLRGKPKGIAQVLWERELWPAEGMIHTCSRRPKKEDRICSGTHCCATRLLSLQPDFRAQKCNVQDVIESQGHLCTFLPKFHPELNWIEYFWGQTKRYTRWHCAYDIKSLRKNVPAALDSVPRGSPPAPPKCEILALTCLSATLTWKYWRKSQRILHAYRDGFTYGTKEFTQRAYKQHRTVSLSLGSH